MMFKKDCTESYSFVFFPEIYTWILVQISVIIPNYKYVNVSRVD